MDFNNLSEIIVGVGLGLLGISFGLQQYIKNWKSTKVESSLITSLHTELERYSKQNKDLFEEVSNLQIQMRELNANLTKLTSENEKLHLEVSYLTTQIDRLKGSIPTGE